MLSLRVQPTVHYGLAASGIRMGDVALFCALVAAFDLAPAWKRRLIKDFNHKTSLAQDLDRLTVGASNARPEYQGVLAALAGADPKGAHALVTDLLSIAGITAVGGRSVSEIADHFLEQAALGAQPSLPRHTRALIETFLAIAGNPHAAAGKLKAFAREAKIGLDPAIERFESRTRAIAESGVDVAAVHFSTAFGGRDRRPVGARGGASWHHGRRLGARENSRRGAPHCARRRTGLRPRQCGSRGTAGVDRRAQHGRSRRRRNRVSSQARAQDAPC